MFRVTRHSVLVDLQEAIIALFGNYYVYLAKRHTRYSIRERWRTEKRITANLNCSYAEYGLSNMLKGSFHVTSLSAKSIHSPRNIHIIHSTTPATEERLSLQLKRTHCENSLGRSWGMQGACVYVEPFTTQRL